MPIQSEFIGSFEDFMAIARKCGCKELFVPEGEYPSSPAFQFDGVSAVVFCCSGIPADIHKALTEQRKYSLVATVCGGSARGV